MNRFLKRCISLFLSAGLLSGTLPAAVYADENTVKIADLPPEIICGEEAQTVSISADPLRPIEPLTFSYENPISMGYIWSAADTTAETTAEESLEYHLTREGAAAEIREYMKKRTETFEIRYVMTSPTNEEMQAEALAVYLEAFTHTGVPTEGDYIKWHVGDMSGDITGYTNGTTYYLTFTYTNPYHTTAAQEAEVDTAVENLLDTLFADTDALRSRYETVKAIYDWICANVTYDYDNLDDETYKLKFTAYAALIDQTAVCQGYALLLYRLLLEMDIDCRLIPGTGSNDAHGWNIIQLGDVYYNADSTWDAGKTEYDWFLTDPMTFTENGTEHIRDMEYDTEEFHAAYPMAEENYVYESVSRSGDTNGDGSVTTADALYLLRYTLLPARFPLYVDDADYTEDDTINSLDALYLFLNHTGF